MRQLKHYFLLPAAACLVAFGPLYARADNFTFDFAGPGVSGTVSLTYGTATDAKYGHAYEITGITGAVSDANIGISNALITGLEPVNYATPEPTNLLAPHDFSRFAIGAGLPEQSNGVATFDNLYWPGGSPQTGSDYPFSGGFLDVYGLLFDIGNGQVVNLWSNGVTPGSNSPNYGIAISTSAQSLDYIGAAAWHPHPSRARSSCSALLGLAWKRFSASRASA